MKENAKHFSEQRNVLMKMTARKPVVSVTSKDLPAIESWEVGKTYTIYGQVELKGLRKSDSGIEGELELIELSNKETKEEDD